MSFLSMFTRPSTTPTAGSSAPAAPTATPGVTSRVGHLAAPRASVHPLTAVTVPAESAQPAPADESRVVPVTGARYALRLPAPIGLPLQEPGVDPVLLEAWLGAGIRASDLVELAAGQTTADPFGTKALWAVIRGIEQRTAPLWRATPEAVEALLASQTVRLLRPWWLAQWRATIALLSAHQRLMRHLAHPSVAAQAGVSHEAAFAWHLSTRRLIHRLLVVRTALSSGPQRGASAQAASPDEPGAEAMVPGSAGAAGAHQAGAGEASSGRAGVG